MGAGRASAGGGAALGGGWAARWAETPEARGGDGADGPRAMAYIGVGGWVICSRRLFGGLAEGGTGWALGGLLFSPGATS